MRPTHERVREALAYDPETGVFTWLMGRGNQIRVGDVAGSPKSDGYWEIRLDGVLLRANVLAWLYMTGAWPTHEVDHIDGDPLNNAFTNLRDEPKSTNMRNIVAPRRDNTTGFRGVTKQGNSFIAQIWVDGKQNYLGSFTTAAEAGAAYMAAKAEHHGPETYQGRLDREG